MKRATSTLSLLALILASGVATNPAATQDATTLQRPNIGWSPGAVCADGYALTFVGGQLQCVDSINRSNEAATAASATTAGTAQQLDPNATVSANQISGQINSQQIQAPTCGSGQVLTNNGSGLTCVAAASSGGPAQPQCPAQNASITRTDGVGYSGYQSFGNSHPLGTGVVGQVQAVSGSVGSASDFYGDSVSYTLTFTCNSAGAWKSQTSQPVYFGNWVNGGYGGYLSWSPGS